jgi:hypothetical protein
MSMCLGYVECNDVLKIVTDYRKLSHCSRNYNPAERRSKGSKERSLKGNKSSKSQSLQANRLSSPDSADGGNMNPSDL